MLTVTAPVGQSVSHGMQYQHSSYFMYALPVRSLIRSTSRGHTSTQTVHPLSAMHLASSTMTGTVVGVWAIGMRYPSLRRVGGCVGGRRRSARILRSGRHTARPAASQLSSAH